MTAWLLAWLWQGVAMAAGVSVAFRVLPRVSASTRHLVWCCALVALAWLGWTQAPVNSLPVIVPVVPAGETLEVAFSIGVTPLPEWFLGSILFVWATVALFRLVRILPGLHALYRSKDACRAFPRFVEDRLPLWNETRGAGRAVRLMLCDELPGAAVLGFHHPCIAIPPSFLETFTSSELDQIVLHEYGHVQRRDDWIGLLLALLDAALWIHPGAGWIRRQITLEREVACDDWVVSRTGAPRDYARCLARVAEIRRPARVPAFAPGWSAGRGHLVRRVSRLLDAHRNARRSPSMAAMAGVAALAVVTLQLRAFPLVAETRQVSGFEVRSSEYGVPGSGFLVPGSRLRFLDPAERAPSSDDVNVGRWSAASELRNLPGRSPNPEPITRSPKPGTGHPEPGTPNLEPGTPNPEPRTPNPIAPAAPVDASVIAARTFEGSYGAAALPPIPRGSHSNPWRFAGRSGAEVGAAARTAGVGIASSVTRASLSIARVF